MEIASSAPLTSPGVPMMTLGVSVTLLLAACGGPVGIVRGDLQGETGLVSSPARASIAGRVLDGSGAAVPGAVLLTDPRGFESTADASGAFEFPWLPAGAFELIAVAPGWEPARSEVVDLVEGDALELDLSLLEPSRTGVVTATVTGPDGQPLQGAVLRASDGSEAVSDALGVAVLAGLEGEDLLLELTHPDEELWGRRLEGQRVTGSGGLQWSAQLAGRSDGEVERYGQAWCALCHADVAETFAASPHGRAFSREPDGALREALEAGLVLHQDGADLALRLQGDTATATIVDALGVAMELEIVGFLGDTSSQAVPLVALGDQHYPLPVVWLASAGDREGYPCSEEGLVAFEPERWFADGAFAFGGESPDAASSAEALCLPCHVSGFELSPRDDGGVEMVFEDGSWQDDGVGCESCHGHGESHLYSMSPEDIVQPWLLDAERADEICAQCHARTVGAGSGMPHPFGEERPFQPGEVLADTTESAAAYWSSGAAMLPHMQYDEHHASGHGRAGAGLRCIDCHAVHGQHGELKAGLLRADAHDNSLCEGCHLAGSFGGDIDSLIAHTGHPYYQPEFSIEGGRCVRCHMVPTAADVAWCDVSGAGSLSSHGFQVLAPQHTLDVFEDRGAQQLSVGEAPPHACVDCHSWNDWLFDGLEEAYPGISGSPTLRSTHEAYQAAYEDKLP